MEQRTLDYDTWTGRTAYDAQGEKLGEIKDIFYDDATGRPEWAEIKMGMFKGTRIVPLHGARIEQERKGGDADGRLILGYQQRMVGDAPDMDTADEHLSPEQEKELYRYYGFDWSDRNDRDFGYGKSFEKQRFGAIHEAPKIRETDQRMSERTEEVPVHAEMKVPIDTSVRLRRYQTEKQRTETRQVEVPVTETEEHVEVVDADAKQGRVDAGR